MKGDPGPGYHLIFVPSRSSPRPRDKTTRSSSLCFFFLSVANPYRIPAWGVISLN